MSSFARLHRSQGARTASGFTLVELLTVVAIMILISAAAVPAFNAIMRGNKVAQAATEVAGTLNQARSYAMANNTYVFVGFAERDARNPAQAGVGQILMLPMGSRDGTRDFGTDGANLVPLSNLHKIDHLRFEESLPSTGNMTRPELAAAYRLASEAFDADELITYNDVSFNKIIQFGPRGTASVPASTDSMTQWLEIGLVPFQASGEMASDGNCAAIQLNGVTGATKVYRP